MAGTRKPRRDVAELPPLEPNLRYREAEEQTGISRHYWANLVKLRKIPHRKLGTGGRTSPVVIPESAIRQHLAECERDVAS